MKKLLKIGGVIARLVLLIAPLIICLLCWWGSASVLLTIMASIGVEALWAVTVATVWLIREATKAQRQEDADSDDLIEDEPFDVPADDDLTPAARFPKNIQ